MLDTNGMLTRKTLDKLIKPKFKVGDEIVNSYMEYMGAPGTQRTILKITDDKYISTDGSRMSISGQDSWDLLSDMLEPKTLDDDKIKTAIRNHLLEMWERCQKNVYGVHVADAITWLKKQGEPDKNPNSKTIAEYLYKEKGYPISLNEEIPTFEVTMKDVREYNAYKEKKLIEIACKWLREQKEMIGISFQEDFIERFKVEMNKYTNQCGNNTTRLHNRKHKIMTQTEKELLMNDHSCRIPYGVILNVNRISNVTISLILR